MRKILLIVGLTVGIVQFAAAQEVVTGMVTDRKGVPVPGARVTPAKLDGPSALTDVDGIFQLETERKPRRVVAEYVGFHPRKASTKRDPLMIKLKKESKLSYQGEFSVGYGMAHLSVPGLETGLGTFNHFVFETVHGIRFNDYLFTGLGIRLQEGDIALPALFADIRAYWPVTKRFMPYLDLNVGYAGCEPEKDVYDPMIPSDPSYEEDPETRSLLATRSSYGYDSDTVDNGFYLAYGVGFHFGHLNVGAGLQHVLMAERIRCRSFYVKIGVKW